MINRKGVSVSPCRTPTRISKNSVSPSGVSNNYDDNEVIHDNNNSGTDDNDGRGVA